MLTNGHIQIYRQLTEWGWYKDIPTCKLWLHILLRANFKESQFMGRDIARGAFVTSLQGLADESGLTLKQVRTALAKLKKTGEITVESNRHYTVVTVARYDEYQAVNGQTEGKKRADQGQTEGKPRATEEESKKARKQESKKEGAPAPDLAERFSEPALSAVRDWITYKQERREGYKAIGLKSLLTEIENRVKQHGGQAVAEVIRLSMANNWKGIIWDRVKDAPKPQAEAKPEEVPDWELAWRAQKEEIRRKMREDGYER